MWLLLARDMLWFSAPFSAVSFPLAKKPNAQVLAPAPHICPAQASWKEYRTCRLERTGQIDTCASLKKKYIGFFPDPTSLSNCGTCAYLHSLHLMTSFRTKGTEAAAKEPKPTIGKTKVVRGTRTADLMDLALNQGGQGCVFGAPWSFRHP
jgi:hypothetical protein